MPITEERQKAELKSIEAQLKVLKQHKLAIMSRERCKYFVPDGGQEKCIKSIMPDTFICVVSGANNTGKTVLQVNILANLIYGPQNDWFDTFFFRHFERPFTARYVSDGTTIEEKIVPELEKWLKQGTYKTKNAGRSFPSQWRFDNGCYLGLMTSDQDPKEFESIDANVIIFDEEVLRDRYVPSVARLRQETMGKAFVLIGFTPVSHSQWIFDDIVNRADGHTIVVNYVDSEESCIEHGIRGRVPHSVIERNSAEYDPDEREARLHGRPQKLYGRIHKLFSRDIHCIKTLDGIGGKDNRYTYYFMLDPHDRRPPAMSWGAVDKYGEYYTIREWPVEPFHKLKSCSLTYDEVAEIIKGIERDMGIDGKVFRREIDPRWYNKVYPNTRLTVTQEYRRRGIKFSPQLNLRWNDWGTFEATGRKKFNEFLKPTKRMNGEMIPRWHILDDCHNHIYALEHWIWGENMGRVAERKGIKESPEDKNKCFCNLLHFWVMSDARYRVPTVKKEVIRYVEERDKRWGITGY